MLEEEQRAAACLSRRRPLPAFHTPPFVAACAFKVRSWSCSPHLKCPTPTSTRSRERHISISAGAGSFSFLPGFGQVPARCCWLVVLCMVLIPAMWSRAHRTIRINAPIPPPIPYHIFSLVYTVITCHACLCLWAFGASFVSHIHYTYSIRKLFFILYSFSFSCSHVASHVAVGP